MGFFCQRCGECCSQMGEVIRIREEFDGLEFLIFYQYTGEERIVRVDPGKRALFMHSPRPADEPLSCPFLRRDRGGLSCCTVHGTRPDICMEYTCWTMLILDSHGTRAGRVMGSGHFSPDDPGLRLLWDEYILELDRSDKEAWEQKVSAILSGEGYTVLV